MSSENQLATTGAQPLALARYSVQDIREMAETIVASKLFPALQRRRRSTYAGEALSSPSLAPVSSHRTLRQVPFLSAASAAAAIRGFSTHNYRHTDPIGMPPPSSGRRVRRGSEGMARPKSSPCLVSI